MSCHKRVTASGARLLVNSNLNLSRFTEPTCFSCSCTNMPITVRTSPSAQKLLERYSAKNRVLYTTKSRLTYLERQAPRAKKTLTPAQKAARQGARTENRDKFNAYLDKALRAVWELAESLAEEFPNHTAKYYYQLLLQTGHKRGTRRKVNMWNAFLHIENQKAAGESSFIAHQYYSS